MLRGGEEINKEIIEIIQGFEKTLENMDEVANVMRAAQLRHADALNAITDGPWLPGDTDATTAAILDIVSAIASAQILVMEIAQAQMRVSMKQLGGMIEEGDES